MTNPLRVSMFDAKSWATALWWAVVVTIWLVLPSSDPATVTINLGVFAAIYAILAYSVAFLFGGGGLLSIAHGGLWGIGAYVAALLTIHYDWTVWLALPVAMAVSAVLSLLMGYPSLRVKGHYFVIVTFGFAELVRIMATNWKSVTKGDLGLSILSRGTHGELVHLEERTDWYYAGGVAVAVVVLVLYLLRRSRFGRRLVAIRENETLASAISIDTTRVKVAAFVVAGVLAGGAGVLWAHYVRYVHPGQFGAEPALLVILMVLIGGARTITGPLIGATLIVFVPDWLGLSPIQNEIAIGVLLVLVILIFPKGIAPLVERTFDSLWSRMRPVPEHVDETLGGRFHSGEVSIGPDRTVGAPILVAQGIFKRYGGVQAVQGVDISVHENELLAVVGPNGSGKSTLFGILSGFVTSDDGVVEWEGRDVSAVAGHRRARQGLVRTFQERMVFPDLTVDENITTALVGAGRDASPEEVAKLAEYVRLSHRRSLGASSLSWGETRLLGIALALAQQPRLLLLDEPFAGLSPIAAQDVTEIISRLVEDGYSLGVIDHEMAYLLPLCTRVVLLDHGLKIFDGPPAEFLDDEAVASAYLGAPDAAV